MGKGLHPCRGTLMRRRQQLWATGQAASTAGWMDILLAMAWSTWYLCSCCLQTPDCCSDNLPFAEEQLIRIVTTRQIFKSTDLSPHSLHLNEAFGIADIISRKKKSFPSEQSQQEPSMCPYEKNCFYVTLNDWATTQAAQQARVLCWDNRHHPPHIEILHISDTCEFSSCSQCCWRSASQCIRHPNPQLVSLWEAQVDGEFDCHSFG